METATICARGISLHDLLPDAQLCGADDIHVTSCTSDSRLVARGDLFVALCGSRDDGHHFAREAVDRGARAVLAERPVPVGGVPTCLVQDTRQAYGLLCQALAGNPSHDLNVVGVTGTAGKTVTASLIAAMLTEAGARVGILGTLGYSDGDHWLPAPQTTPPPPMLANSLGRMVAAGCSHAVVEVSSKALSQARVAGISFDMACVTNVGRDHLDYHSTVENYRNAKAKLLDYLSPTGLVVLNADDPVCTGWLARIDGPALTVGIDKPAELTAMLVEQHRSEQTFLLSAGNETVPVRTHLMGIHQIHNCLIAAAVGLVYGMDLPTVVRGIESVHHVPGRMERIECGQPFTVVVDFARGPDTLATSLTALRQVTGGRILCVFGARGERGRAERPVLGAVASKLADELILTSDNPRTEMPEQIVDDIRRGVTQPAHAHTILNRGQAIRWALAAAQPGDCVLIAGKGHETYQAIGNQRYPFDDRQTAREILYAEGGSKICSCR